MTSSIPQLIESCGFCRAGEVEGLQKMKTGMTNRSYSFFARGGQYIIRVPGEGTEQMINRAQEHAVYNVIAPLGITLYTACSCARLQWYRPAWDK